jgi:hypothetical protein
MIINTGPILIAVLAGIFLREGFPQIQLRARQQLQPATHDNPDV